MVTAVTRGNIPSRGEVAVLFVALCHSYRDWTWEMSLWAHRLILPHMFIYELPFLQVRYHN